MFIDKIFTPTELEFIHPLVIFKLFAGTYCFFSKTCFFINSITCLSRDFSDCPQPVNALLIILPVVGGIVLIGLIALIVWKIYQTLHDKQEYESFMEESKQKKWIQVIKSQRPKCVLPPKNIPRNFRLKSFK